MIINSMIIGKKDVIELSSLIITKQPTKTSYNAKEAFDSSGMEVKAVFSNDAYKMVTDFNIEPSDELKFSDTKVKVKYTELGVTAEVEQQITVSALTVNIPTIDNANITYTGSTITPVWNNYDSSLVTISGDTSALNAGSYKTIFALKEPEYYKWNDGSTGSKTINWSIQKASVTIPSVSDIPVYTGSQITPTWNNYNSGLMTIGGETSGTNAGTYTVTFALKDTVNYTWSDGTTANKTVTWTINKVSVSIPTANTTSFNYTGSAITPTWNNYNNNLVTGTNISATNAGTYTATFALKDSSNYQWSDGTITNKTISWTINKVKATITLNKTSVSLNNNNTSDTVTITSVGMSNITATSSNTNVAAVSKSGNTLTISSVNNTTGTATITLSGTPDSNHTAPTYPTIAVTANFIIYISSVPSASIMRYTGSTISPTWSNYNSTQLTIGGTTSATNIGKYNATFTPKSGYAWSDGTTTAKTVTWEIRDNWANVLKDFNYTENSDGTATITGWKQTLNGTSSTELVIPNNPRIIL